MADAQAPGGCDAEACEIVDFRIDGREHNRITDQPQAFDVSAATFARAAAERIRQHQAGAVAAIIAIGRELISVRDRLDHGQFGGWLAEEFDFTDRTARNFMRVAEVFGRNGNGVSVLPQATVYKLAAKSTPPEIVGKVLAAIEAGEPVDVQKIEREVDDARKRARMAAAEAKISDKARKARARRAAKHKQERVDYATGRAAKMAAAEIAAHDLIARHGVEAIKAVLEADWDVQGALRAAVSEAA